MRKRVLKKSESVCFFPLGLGVSFVFTVFVWVYICVFSVSVWFSFGFMVFIWAYVCVFPLG
jgi:hypothetical protein